MLLLIICLLWTFQLTLKFNPYKSMILTTNDKTKIPAHIHAQWTHFFTGDVSIADDKDCIAFLSTYYGQRYVDKFNYMKSGAHKADLFRYAWLYKNGGIYMDIKTILIKPLESIFDEINDAYFVITKPDRIYNGIIATPRENPIIKALLDDVMLFDNDDTYLTIVNHGYAILLDQLNVYSLRKGVYYGLYDIPIHIFEEKFYSNSICNNEEDRYGVCTYAVNQHNERIIKIRDATYPW